MKILTLGDCNTYLNTYFKNGMLLKELSECKDVEFQNCGYTMSTTREMVHFFNEFKTDDTELILIQYGLVDSWKTFKHAPYVLYYPDNKLRKIYRKIVKKYKKVTKKLGLYELFGSENTVPLEEYRKNIEYVIGSSKNSKIYLIDTVPSKQIFRNEEIQRYNKELDKIAKAYDNVFRIKLYDHFFLHMDDYYVDHIHLNDIGYEYIIKSICEHYLNHFKYN